MASVFVTRAGFCKRVTFSDRKVPLTSLQQRCGWTGNIVGFQCELSALRAVVVLTPLQNVVSVKWRAKLRESEGRIGAAMQLPTFRGNLLPPCSVGSREEQPVTSRSPYLPVTWNVRSLNQCVLCRIIRGVYLWDTTETRDRTVPLYKSCRRQL